MAVAHKQVGQVCWRPQHHPSQAHYPPEFAVAVNLAAYSDWRKSWQRDNHLKLPLIEVVDSVDILTYRGGGRSGHLERPSDQMLQDAFGTSDTAACIEHVLKEGDLHMLPHGNEMIPGDRRPFRFHSSQATRK